MPEPICTISKAARLCGLEYHATRSRLVHEGRVASVRVAGTRRIRLSECGPASRKSPRVTD